MTRFGRHTGLLGLALICVVGFLGCGGSSGSLNVTPTNASPTDAGHSVDLAWNPSASAVVGYKVYRSTPGQEYALLSSLSSETTTYTDWDVSAGETYAYVVTAVNDAGVESAPTPPVTAVIPDLVLPSFGSRETRMQIQH